MLSFSEILRDVFSCTHSDDVFTGVDGNKPVIKRKSGTDTMTSPKVRVVSVQAEKTERSSWRRQDLKVDTKFCGI